MNGAWSPRKGDLTLLNSTVPTTPTSAQAAVTRSLGRALIPFLYAIVATLSAILMRSPHDDEIMFQLLHHAVNSSLQTIKSVATYMLLSHWRGFSCNAYMSWLNHY
eukprot:1143458-Pelagomonas_calceolata.AAC.2